MSQRFPLHLEVLETREVLSVFGVPWPAPERITLSFVPDDPVGQERGNELFHWLDGQMPRQTWQHEILRAFQAWATGANLNIVVVDDLGLPAGTSGAVQGDPRFGDIRVGARAMSDEVLGVGSPFDPLAGTWAGDVNLNSRVTVGPGGVDLFTLVLHEAGHVLGLDHQPDPGSAMAEEYTGPKVGPAPSDFSLLQQLYGIRPADEFDSKASNDLLTDASRVSVSANAPTTLNADLTTGSDVDYYSISLPGGTAGGTVRLHVAGHSLLEAELAILDGDGNVVGTATSLTPGGDLLLTIPAGLRNFVVRVRSSDPDFAVGAYELEIAPEQKGNGPAGHPDHPTPPGHPAEPPVINLQPRTYRSDERFSYYVADALSEASPARTYRFFAPHDSAREPGPLTILAWASEPGTFRPRLTLTDVQGQPVAARVLVNEDGTVLLQVDHPMADGAYLLRVEGGVGAFQVGISFGGPLDQLETVVADRVVSPEEPLSTPLHATSSQLFHFVLSATAGPAEMVLEDAEGNLVRSLSVEAGETATDTFYLLAGDYRILIVATGKESLVRLEMVGLSDPLGPTARDVIQSPQPLPPGSVESGYWWEPPQTGVVLPPPLPGTPLPPDSGATDAGIPAAGGNPAADPPSATPAPPTGESPTPVPRPPAGNPFRPAVSAGTVGTGARPTVDELPPVSPVQLAPVPGERAQTGDPGQQQTAVARGAVRGAAVVAGVAPRAESDSVPGGLTPPLLLSIAPPGERVGIPPAAPPAVNPVGGAVFLTPGFSPTAEGNRSSGLLAAGGTRETSREEPGAAPGLLVAPRVEGILLPAPLASTDTPPAEQGGVPVQPTGPLVAGPVASPTAEREEGEPGQPAPAPLSWWRALALTLLVGATSVWLWQQPRRGAGEGEAERRLKKRRDRASQTKVGVRP